MKAPYFPFYPDDWLESEHVFLMGLEMEGAYIRLLASMWSRGGGIPDNPQIVCNILRCKPAKWRKIRACLVDEHQVIFERDGALFNAKIEREMETFSQKVEKNRTNANKRWSERGSKKQEKANKNNEGGDATAKRPQCHREIEEKQKENKYPPTPQKGEHRANAEDRGGEGKVGSKAERFEEWWSAYPKKIAKKACLAKWQSRGLDTIADQLIADVQARIERDRKWIDGFAPNPLTYINGDRWDDQIETASARKGANAGSKIDQWMSEHSDDAIEGEVVNYARIG